MGVPGGTVFTMIPTIYCFVNVSLISPFGDSHCIVTSLPLVTVLFTFSFVEVFALFGGRGVHLTIPMYVLLTSIATFIAIGPCCACNGAGLCRPGASGYVFIKATVLR